MVHILRVMVFCSLAFVICMSWYFSMIVGKDFALASSMQCTSSGRDRDSSRDKTLINKMGFVRLLRQNLGQQNGVLCFCYGKTLVNKMGFVRLPRQNLG